MGFRKLALVCCVLVLLPAGVWAQRNIVKGEACGGDLGGTMPDCTVTGAQADSIGTTALDDNADIPAVDELIRVDSSDTGALAHGPCTMDNAGGITCPASATPTLSLEDSTNDDSDVDYAVSIVDNASNDTQVDYQVEIAGTPQTWLHFDGFNNNIEVGHATGVADLSLITDEMNVDESELARLDGLTGDILTNTGDNTTRSSLFRDANDLSTDGTECSQAVRTVINSGPQAWAIVCPMGTAETDGFVYGMMQLPGGFDASMNINFNLYGYLNADNGAGTFHGVMKYQCVANDDIIGSTWQTGGEADFIMDGAEAQYDRVVAALQGITLSTCAGNETLFIRWRACDTDASPATDCTSSAGFEADVDILHMRLEFQWSVAD